MSKEYLEAFKNLKQELYYSPNQIPDVDKWHETIEEALQRLEAIDNANPSEALEKLLDGYSKGIAGRSYYDAIKPVLLKEQEQEKVLDIIKKKVTNLVCIDDDCVWDNELYCSNKLTKEESDLLKRYLK